MVWVGGMNQNTVAFSKNPIAEHQGRSRNIAYYSGTKKKKELLNRPCNDVLKILCIYNQSLDIKTYLLMQYASLIKSWEDGTIKPRSITSNEKINTIEINRVALFS
jgi:hypothetical protein